MARLRLLSAAPFPLSSAIWGPKSTMDDGDAHVANRPFSE